MRLLCWLGIHDYRQNPPNPGRQVVPTGGIHARTVYRPEDTDTCHRCGHVRLREPWEEPPNQRPKPKERDTIRKGGVGEKDTAGDPPTEMVAGTSRVIPGSYNPCPAGERPPPPPAPPGEIITNEPMRKGARPPRDVPCGGPAGISVEPVQRLMNHLSLPDAGMNDTSIADRMTGSAKEAYWDVEKAISDATGGTPPPHPPVEPLPTGVPKTDVWDFGTVYRPLTKRDRRVVGALHEGMDPRCGYTECLQTLAQVVLGREGAEAWELGRQYGENTERRRHEPSAFHGAVAEEVTSWLLGPLPGSPQAIAEARRYRPSRRSYRQNGRAKRGTPLDTLNPPR